jgi:hypothetical protein
MSNRNVLLTAAELDELTPDQRAAALRERIVTDLDTLPLHFRERITETAAMLAARAPTKE